ncbi:MAG: hypothetical protein B6D56_02905 [Candidatus Omnitrophica bacterium 4484_70.1]|nr:MAG: hypothetical protein B6D56_02905 [Candidatus Omnitrophica bacterium 4484_70.1]
MKNLVEKLKSLPSPLKEVISLSSQVAKSFNYRVYLVGGIVRDFVLGRENFDLDIVVEGDAIRLVKKLAYIMKARFCRHIFFGTATLYLDDFKIDFATARKEYYPRKGALPCVSPSTLKDDLFRRDFTINAMAIGLNRDDYGRLIDYYHGLDDLKRGLIRILHKESFFDDPTRIFRAIRFEKRFSFSIEKNTLLLLKEAVKKGALSWVDEHRIRDELFLILKEANPYRYIKRINSLLGFKFIDIDLELKREDFLLLQRLEKAIRFYHRFSFLPKLNIPIIYLSGILGGIRCSYLELPLKLSAFSNNFGLRKEERKIVMETFEYIKKLKKLEEAKYDKIKIYDTLKPLSMESIVFYYAYFKDKVIRRSIRIFWKELFSLRLFVQGRDLKKLGVIPPYKFGEYLKRLLHRKIKLGLKTKEEELKELKKMIKIDKIRN